MDMETNHSDEFSDFWLATWSVWRSGQLDSLIPSLRRCAEGRFEDFGRERGAYPEDVFPIVRSCFSSYPPLHGEYLILTISARKDELSMLVTNLRVWIYDDLGSNLHCLNLKDIERYEFSSNLSSVRASIFLKDGTNQEFRNSRFCKEETFTRILSRCNSAEGFPASPSPSQVRTEQGQATKLLPSRERAESVRHSAGKKEKEVFAWFALVGLVAGSIIGEMFDKGEFVVQIVLICTLVAESIAMIVNRANRSSNLNS